MDGNLVGYPQTDLERWLHSLHFLHHNPFGTIVAETEREMLPKTFVDVHGYEAIKGEQSIVVFAPRGSGKSALRIVLASNAAPIAVESEILAVEFTDFFFAGSKYRSGDPITVNDYVKRVLRVGVEALWNCFGGPRNATHLASVPLEAMGTQSARAGKVGDAARAQLGRAVRSYHARLLAPESILSRLQSADPAYSPNWWMFSNACESGRLGEFLAQTPGVVNETAQLLADANDFSMSGVESVASPLEELLLYRDLCRACGFFRVVILVDRLDELVETADNWEAQADILEPLLGHPQLLELENIPFKLFLPTQVRDVLLERRTIRWDRLKDQAITLRWSQSQLKRLLDERLSVYSDGAVVDLSQLCAEEYVEHHASQGDRMLVGAWIEEEMLQLAQGSPRRLLMSAQLLFESHVEHFGPSGWLQAKDWESARSKLQEKAPLGLRIHRTQRQISSAAAAERTAQLSPMEHSILLHLANNGGYAEREDLVDAVWGGAAGVTEAAVDQAIKRTRDKIRVVMGTDYHLVTVRGKGVRLNGFEVT